jgi:hypothetical protein
MGSKPLTLLPSDYITSGGEGSIYRKGDIVFKVYHNGFGNNVMENKIKLLGRIKHKGIVSPEEILYDKQDQLVGFTMPAIEGEVLVRFFNNEYRNRVNFGIRETTAAVYEMKEIVGVAHAHQALLVDANEMNYLITPKEEVCIIDVDSWQIGPFKAAVIMASIRDYHTQGFSELTDWFSWAVVSFQLFVGIHPFKGRHPQYKPGAFVERMKDGISIFNTGVLLPSTARDLKDVPANLLEWYEAVFEGGDRSLPPATFETQPGKKILQKTVYLTGVTGTKVVFTKVQEFHDKIIKVFPNGAVLTEKRLYTRTGRVGIELSQLFHRSFRKDEEIWCISTDDGIVAAKDNNPTLLLLDGDTVVQQLPTCMSNILLKYFQHGNRLFYVSSSGITETTFGKMGKVIMTFPGNTWGLSPQSTFFGDGVAVYDALGTPFIVLPFDKTACLIEKEDNLKGKRLIASKGVNNFVTCLVKDSSGQNFKVEILYPNLADSWGTPKTWVGPTDETGLNFAVNHRGTVATIVEDGELIVFSPVSGQSKTIADKHLRADMQLCTVYGNIGFIKDNELWSLTTT